jgi:multidrug efflux system membrane fusion protein
MGLASENGCPHAGTLDFVDNRVNPNTGAISVRAVVPNPRPAGGVRLLSPGMFVRVRLPLGAPYAALLISDDALWSDQGQKFVYIVDAKNAVQSRPVKVGSLQDGLRVITDGLKADEWVGVAGLQRLRPGQTVHPQRVPMPGARKVGGAAAPAPPKQPMP